MRFVLGWLLLTVAVCVATATTAEDCRHGELSSVPGRPDEYYECISGVLVRKSCEFLLYFDGKQCVPFIQATAKKTPCIEGMIYERATCAMEYDFCYNGRIHKEICPALYRFNGEACVPMEECDISKCKEGDIKPIDQTSYNQCTNGQYVKKFCDQGAVFNKLTNMCEQRRPMYTNFKQSTKCTGVVRQPLSNCSEYLECFKGQFVKKSCPGDMLFDKNDKMCRLKWDATCWEESCENGQLTPDQDSCAIYYSCEKNSQVRKECDSWWHGYYFDPIKEECSSDQGVCRREVCKGDWVQTSSNCKVYTICRNGYMLSYTCPLFSVYNNGKCSIWNKCLPSKALTSAVQQTEKCVENAKTRVFGRCSEFKQCIKGQWKMMKCPKGTNFQVDACEAKPCPLRPVLNRCDLFMEPGSDKQLKCPLGYLFDVVSRQCVYTAAATCATGECIEMEKTNHPTDCTKYKECKDGKWETQSCSFIFNHFDNQTKQCRFWKYNCQYKAANCTEVSKRPNPENCKQYEQCVEKSWRAEKCWFWQHFDSKSDSCRTFSYKCSTNRTEKLSQIGENSQIIMASQCVEGETKPVDNTCRYYTECVKGQIVTRKCSPCQNYNLDEKKCDWVWKKPCASDVTDPPHMTTSWPTSMPTTPKPECKENDKRGVKNDCTRYQICQGGKWILERCLFRFDIVSKQCVWLWWKATCA